MSANEAQRDTETPDVEMGDDRFDGGDLCPACLAELTAGCGFCPKCGAPVTPTVAISPFERIFAEGYIYRQAVASPRKFIIVLGVWLVFLPMLLIGLAMFAWDWFFERTDVLYLCEGLFLALVGAMGLYHVTWNYVQRPVFGSEPDSGSGEV